MVPSCDEARQTVIVWICDTWRNTSTHIRNVGNIYYSRCFVPNVNLIFTSVYYFMRYLHYQLVRWFGRWYRYLRATAGKWFSDYAIINIDIADWFSAKRVKWSVCVEVTSWRWRVKLVFCQVKRKLVHKEGELKRGFKWVQYCIRRRTWNLRLLQMKILSDPEHACQWLWFMHKVHLWMSHMVFKHLVKCSISGYKKVIKAFTIRELNENGHSPSTELCVSLSNISIFMALPRKLSNWIKF